MEETVSKTYNPGCSNDHRFVRIVIKHSGVAASYYPKLIM